MKRYFFIFFALLCMAVLQAQEVKIDKELKNFVDAVLLLRQGNTTNRNTVKATLNKNTQWTLMDELKDENHGECFLSKKMKRFNLNPIIASLLTSKYGKNHSRGDFLSGEDPRFNFSMIEKGIQAKRNVKYTFKGRVGKQDFVIIPCDPDADLNIKLSKGNSPLKTVQQRTADGCIYLHSKTKLKSTDQITLEIENKLNSDVSIAILNHNTRK